MYTKYLIPQVLQPEFVAGRVLRSGQTSRIRETCKINILQLTQSSANPAGSHWCLDCWLPQVCHLWTRRRLGHLATWPVYSPASSRHCFQHRPQSGKESRGHLKRIPTCEWTAWLYFKINNNNVKLSQQWDHSFSSPIPLYPVSDINLDTKDMMSIFIG